MRARKAITPVIAIVLLLMMTVAAAGMAYTFVANMQKDTQQAVSENIDARTDQMSTCMAIDYVYGNTALLRNCGEGEIANGSIVALIDGAAYKFAMSPATISYAETATVNLSGIWALAPGQHGLQFKNGLASASMEIIAEPNPDGLAGHWSFDEGSGTVAGDASGNGNDAALLPSGSGPVWTAGKFGSALQLDGVNDYMSAGSGRALNFTAGTFTILAWAKSTYAGGAPILYKDTNYIFANNAGWGIEYAYTPAKLYVGAANGTARVNYNTGMDNFTWTQVGLSRAPDNTIFFIKNGAEISTGSKLEGIVDNNADLIFGKYGANYFNGTIDEIRIWNRALAPDETVNLKPATR